MSRIIIENNLNEIVENDKRDELSNLLLKDNIIIIHGALVKGYIKTCHRGFVYDVYGKDAVWNQEKEEFNNTFFRDGGICILGDNIDAMNDFIKLLEAEEKKGK